MQRQKLTIVLAAFVAVLVIPSSAVAEYYVPPANSAANQYTESVPGAGGESGGKRRDVHPNATLGAGNAKRLEKEGKAGKEAAEVAAETAPAQLVDSGGSSQSSSGQSSTGDGDSSSGKQSAGKDDQSKGGKSSDSGDESESGSGGGSPAAGGNNGGKGTGGGSPQPEGSSGISQVIGQATGASDGNLGLWLPLAIVLMLVGAVAYGVRTRQVHPGHRA